MTLLLLPNVLGDVRHHELFLPPSVDKAVASLDGLIAESERGGRRFLSRFKHEKKPQDIPIALLNEHTPEGDMDFLLEPLSKGERWGLISDAGMPCIADPGALLVARARKKGIAVQAFSGPSSIMLGLMLSGLPGQQFSFCGYLDRDQKRLETQVRQLEKRSAQENSTQIFIEAPYRNNELLNTLLKNLDKKTLLACAWDLTLQTQGVVSQSVAQWEKCTLPQLDKKPAIFLFCANPAPLENR